SAFSTAYFDNVVFDPVVKGDFNNDDSPELVLRNQGFFGDLEIWRMSGTTRVAQWPVSPQTDNPFMQLVGVDEFTGDSYSDLVFQNALSGEISFWKMFGPTRVGD